VHKSLQQKYDHLRNIATQAGSAVIAFSGGVDSTFLLKVCVDELAERAVAVTARSETFPKRELQQAKSLAFLIGARHLVIDSQELEVPDFSKNPPHRCFLCKSELFSKLKKLAEEESIPWIFDGNNADDAGDFRPGRAAAQKLGVRSPLEEAGLNKEEIRKISKLLDLPTWNKPSFACLSSRFPYHTRITKSALQQVEQAEDFLWNVGMREFRVRHHDTLARLELGEKELSLFWRNSTADKIVHHLKSLGYAYVTLDLEGYRTGSMNETLSTDELGSELQQLSPLPRREGKKGRGINK
jgi:uncharacterized protein